MKSIRTYQFRLSKGSLFRLLFASYLYQKKYILIFIMIAFNAGVIASGELTNAHFIFLGWLALYISFYMFYFVYYIIRSRDSGLFDMMDIEFRDEDFIIRNAGGGERTVHYGSIVKILRLIGYELIYMSKRSFIAIPIAAFENYNEYLNLGLKKS